ncbi:LPXTG cell wall anchor domain-containing protein [Enterococcus sp. DIV0170]|uniref:LPXTG cell wall anchor domain-containing protein n=1 Tax=Enterococcus sp. DIV0170 TaxID=2774642 RepID=UPI003F2423D0
MKKKIASVSFLLLIVSLFTLTAHPGISNAVEADKADTEVGIGFNSNEEKPKEDPKEEPTLPSTKQPEESTPVNNERIPNSTEVKSYSRVYRRLPQTNMQRQFLLSLAGVLLVALFLIVVTHKERRKVRPVE